MNKGLISLKIIQYNVVILIIMMMMIIVTRESLAIVEHRQLSHAPLPQPYRRRVREDGK